MNTALKVSLEQWRSLVAVVDAGGYAQAAKALRKSQSAVTYAVQKLESQLAIKAFEIQGRKAVLTPTGQLLYRRAHALLAEAGSLEGAALTLSAGWEAQIRIAAEVVFPTLLLLDSFARFGLESPHTRIELIESVMGGTNEALLTGQADLAVSGAIPQGFAGDSLLRARFVPATRPDHPLHRLGRKLSLRDLAAHRHLLVRESGSRRDSRPIMEVEQRWTLTHMATSIEAATRGYGWAWFPEEKIRAELTAGTLKILPVRDGGERFLELYLVYADREGAGPGSLRLAEILREEVARGCTTAARRPTTKRATPT
ncbi:MAG TPA: LysR family transcriptional regulator [Steroidobacteraceae bacterium]|nr:LysR family transcriptional regulator [Steroidobacteraceae bacterium]